jgi:pimeloyl-ACP methyl ester carboxylesterase
VVTIPLDSLRARAGAVGRFLRPLGATAEDESELEPFPPQLPEGRVVPVPDRGEMFVRQAPGPSPDAPTVTLLHGWTLSADLNWFSGVYDVAARRGGVVAPDIRGHGRGIRSERPFTLEAAADDVAGMLDQLDISRTVLVGYSMGGSIALLMAERHPGLVEGLVLAATALQWRDSPRERVIWAGMAGVEYVMRFGAPKGLTDRYLRFAAEESPDLEPYSGWLKGEARRGDPSDIAAAGRSLSTFDARDLASRIDVPTAVVVTAHDQLIRAHKQRAICTAIEGARAFEVEGAHNSWMVRPKEFATAIDEALEFVLERPS